MRGAGEVLQRNKRGLFAVGSVKTPLRLVSARLLWQCPLPEKQKRSSRLKAYFKCAFSKQ